jgi:hypothetical protein
VSKIASGQCFVTEKTSIEGIKTCLVEGIKTVFVSFVLRFRLFCIETSIENTKICLVEGTKTETQNK